MKIKQIAKIKDGQDGAVWGNYLFRFDAVGHCYVYDLKDLEQACGEECQYIGEFCLDKADKIKPHSNAVMFGKEYYSADDEFPLLYTNIYNNYAKDGNTMKGVCLVYRLQRNETKFLTTLVQIIEIGFADNSDYWLSKGQDDIRPYGNFTIDPEKGIYYAFTMRDESSTTRYFSFNLPKVSDGNADSEYGVTRVVLSISDIIEYFDCEYHRFVQGAAFYKGKIYSLEGFTESEENPPAMRIIDVNGKKQEKAVLFADFGLSIEPEMIDFYNDVCYYGDNHGNLYTIDFSV